MLQHVYATLYESDTAAQSRNFREKWRDIIYKAYEAVWSFSEPEGVTYPNILRGFQIIGSVSGFV